ncbi:MAG: sulfotransferase [Bacteroidetes bacterium]|nr:sulfotransferase [Bacteroidota bacterium]MBU1719766.1 sulfotransferase [Bacteroidota bacterium]
MRKTIIHIGYPKTGTTWFVKYFYPSVKNADVVFSDMFTLDLKANVPDLVFFDQNLREDTRFIVSHKFCGIVDFQWNEGRNLDFIVPRLAHLFPEAEIVIFLRNQVDFIASAYSSYLTHGGTYTFRKLFRKDMLSDGSMFAWEYLDYHKMVCRYQQHFDKGKVHVFLYEDFLSANRDFVERYAEKFGLDVDIDSLPFRKHNEKLRTRLAGFIRFANLFSKHGAHPKKCLANFPVLFSWLKKEKMMRMNNNKFWGNGMGKDKILGDELMQFIEDYYRDSNGRLVKLTGIENFGKYHYPL